MKHLASILLLSALALSSCRTVIEVPDEEAHRDITVLFAGSTIEGLKPQTMRISRTDFTHFRLKSNAQIDLKVDGISVPVAPATGEKAQGVYTLSYAFTPGQQLEVRVREGEGVATAKAIVPQLPQLIDYSVETIEQKNKFGSTEKHLLWRVRLKDNAGQSDYYRITATRQTIYEEKDTQQELSLKAEEYVSLSGAADPILSEGRPKIDGNREFNIDELFQGKSFTNIYSVFSDAAFANREIEVQLTSPAYGMADFFDTGYYPGGEQYQLVRMTDGAQRSIRYKYDRYTLSLHAISEDLYLYLRTLGRFESTDEGIPIITPVQLYSNIKGGTGIFAVSSVVQQTKVFKSVN